MPNSLTVQQYKARKPLRNIESKLQQMMIRYFDVQYPELFPLLYAIPNGGKRGIITAKIMKAEGVRRGVADLKLAIAKGGYHGLYIEVKTDEGRQNPEQKAFQRAVQMQGYCYRVVRSLDEFIALVKDYLAGYVRRLDEAF